MLEFLCIIREDIEYAITELESVISLNSFYV